MSAYIPYLEMGPIDVHVGFSADPKVFARELRRLGVDEAHPHVCAGAAATTHFLEQNGQSLCIVAIDPAQAMEYRPIEIAGLLAHEAVHVMQECEKSLQEQDGFSAEIQAYIVQWVAQFCMHEWAKHIGAAK